MNASTKLLLAASAAMLASAPAYAANFTLTPIPTGDGDYSFDVSDTALGAGTFTDTFSFTIPAGKDGTFDIGLLNVGGTKSTANIDFISAFLSGTPSDIPLSVSNMGPLSIVSNSAEIAMLAGLTYVVHVTYLAAGSRAGFDGAVSFTAAPEPAAWAMMLLGFGVVGATLRRAQRKPRLAVSYA